MRTDLCPICSSKKVRSFLVRENVPVHQNLIVRTTAEARTIARGTLDMTVCDDCSFVYNRQFDEKRLSYGENYDNTQSCSSFFDDYLDNIVAELVEKRGVKNCNIVEVGCGKGEFLRKLITYPGANNIGFGFDPSYLGPLKDLDGKLNFRQTFYDQSCTDIVADIVVCRHVIEHIDKPIDILSSIRSALRGSMHAKVFFETPCVDWILKNKVIWDFFYEHCSLFNPVSIDLAFRKAGFKVDSIKHIFGDQYLWLVARPGDLDNSLSPPQDTDRLATAFEKREIYLKARAEDYIKELLTHGKVALWGAGAKGMTLANLIDPRCELIDCVVDLNPNKQGRFIAGSGHPIVGPQSLKEREVRNAILMNPNYYTENSRLLSELDIDVELLQWSEI